MNNKYELTNETKVVRGHILHRIKAIVDFALVNKGEIGGWIETGNNLSQDGDAWVCEDAEVYGNAWVCGDARVCGKSDYIVFKNCWSSFRWFTYTRSNKKWSVGCFYGTGEELIEKAYADSEQSGKCYEAIVRAVEAIESAKSEAKGETDGSK